MAEEVVDGLPGRGGDPRARTRALALELQEAVNLRGSSAVYVNDDLTGVELCAAAKET